MLNHLRKVLIANSPRVLRLSPMREALNASGGSPDPRVNQEASVVVEARPAPSCPARNTCRSRLRKQLSGILKGFGSNPMMDSEEDEFQPVRQAELVVDVRHVVFERIGAKR